MAQDFGALLQALLPPSANASPIAFVQQPGKVELSFRIKAFTDNSLCLNQINLPTFPSSTQRNDQENMHEGILI